MREVRRENAGRSPQGITYPLRWDKLETGPPSIPGWQHPEHHMEMMRNFSRLWIKPGQVLEHSLSQKAFGPLIRVILYDSKGLRLKASIAVLWSPIYLPSGGGFHSFLHPFPSSFKPLFLDPHTRWTNFAIPVPQRKPPLGVPWETPPIALGVIKKTVEFVCGVCGRGWVPAHPRKLLCERVMV